MGSTVTTRGIYTKDSIRGYVPDQDITAPWWASKAEDWWVLAAENPYWLGGFVWTGFDYRGEPTPYQRISIIIINRGGRIKMYCILPRTGTGREKKDSRWMYG